ncbi:hypothetical protein [Chitinophaga rhizophila]|uniref:Uncharacterized protein n=1 Tax=Chitinophaga rhizophila TaxID=2866212 RepID=A0ABS7GH81_9BACT|nr:hypothetical protein [Chitinophaga rhizophila]MBW8687049.1 hypothetical protein [Chitinophaga rhizophila]
MPSALSCRIVVYGDAFSWIRRILENNAKPTNYFINNRIDPVPYLQMGVSVLLFWKGLNL